MLIKLKIELAGVRMVTGPIRMTGAPQHCHLPYLPRKESIVI
ncbi:hypothetical protein ES703_81574 [subsurface metagenome]